MKDLWLWICELPSPETWRDSNELVFELASRWPGRQDSAIVLVAERSTSFVSDHDDEEVLVIKFSICLRGFGSDNPKKAIWVSDTCPLSSDRPFLPLVLQLLEETVYRAPTTAHDSTTCPRSQLKKLRPDPVGWVMDTHSPESFSGLFTLLFFTRLFYACVFDAPGDVGSLYFKSSLSPSLDALTCQRGALRAFLSGIGVDVELRFMRAVGYMLAKWLILREVGVGLQTLVPPNNPSSNLGFSYATEAHGFWTLKAHAPVLAMRLTRSNEANKSRSSLFPLLVEPKESVLRYALAHQQLEAVVQLEYSVSFNDGFIEVGARIDNLRFHVVKLGFENGDDGDDECGDDVVFKNERHFPTRIRAWVGPEVGSTYVSSMSLGRSTDNEEREVKTQNIVKGKFGKLKSSTPPKVKATARQTTKTRAKNWRFDQDTDGNAAVFEAVLCDGATGQEAAAWNSSTGKVGLGTSERRRLAGTGTRNGGVVLGGDEYGEEVRWRVGKEMEGSVVKWRIGGKVWLSYWPNEVESSYFETRCVEWCDEVDLPLIR